MIYTFVKLSTGFLEAVALYMIIDSVCKTKETVPKYIYYMLCILLAVIFNISYYMFFGSMENTLIMYVSTILFAMMFSGDLKTKILLTLIGLTFNACSEMSVLYCFGRIFKLTSLELMNDRTLWIAGALLSKFLFLVFANFVRIKYKNQKLLLRTSFWFLLVVVFAPSLTTAFIIFRLMYNVSDPFIYNIALISCIGLVASSFASMYLYEHVAVQSEILNRQRQYEEQIKSQTKHLDEIVAMQNTLRSFRHDIKNHLAAIKGYFANNDCDGGIEYISKISSDITFSQSIDTGNSALDAIIGSKKTLAQKHGITFISTVQIPKQMMIDATDICIIFGNSLDNAIEACDKITSEDKYIKLSVIYDASSVICKISNSISKGKKISLKTTKTDKDNHGFGIDNIKKSLSKYNHVIRTSQSDDEFTLSFIIFNC